ncbi:hypothetical protein ACLB2K_035949 [Fragaria x ananassa]
MQRTASLLFSDSRRRKSINASREGGGGVVLWLYNNFMLILVDYDGVSDPRGCFLNLLEVWVTVKGLQVGMRMEKVLAQLGNILGSFIQADPAALWCKEVVQNI